MLDDKSLRRIGDATRKSELQRKKIPQHTPPAPKNQVHAAKFKLVTVLEHGKSGVGRMMQLHTNEDGSTFWLQTDREEKLFLATGHQTRIDEGAEVEAIFTSNGYAVVSEVLMGRLVGIETEAIPYGVYWISPGGKPGVLSLFTGSDETGFYAWFHDYAFLGDVPDDPPTQEKTPADEVEPKLWPCTTQLPTWAAYDTAPDTGLPEEVIEALGWTEKHPSQGEYWGAAGGPRLQRTAYLMELYWYKWTPPAPACIVNPAYDEIDNPDVPTHVWAGTDVSCDFDTPGDPPDSVLSDPVWWIAPIGYWGSWGYGGWGHNWGWRSGYGWNYPNWYGGYGGSYNYWGGYGYGWWSSRWGGRPPTIDDLPDPDTPVPQPPEGQGVITRECRYGWVLWHWGWRILHVDQERQLAFIHGEFEFFNRVVVETPDHDDCPPSVY